MYNTRRIYTPKARDNFLGEEGLKASNCNKVYKAKKIIYTKVCSMRFFYQVESEDSCAIFR